MLCPRKEERVFVTGEQERRGNPTVGNGIRALLARLLVMVAAVARET